MQILSASIRLEVVMLIKSCMTFLFYHDIFFHGKSLGRVSFMNYIALGGEEEASVG